MILCFVLGFIIGMVYALAGTITTDSRAVRRGLWTHNGNVYQLKEIKPNE